MTWRNRTKVVHNKTLLCYGVHQVEARLDVIVDFCNDTRNRKNIEIVGYLLSNKCTVIVPPND